jgi:hypothetical protein
MAGQLARAVARFIALCPYVQAVHDLLTKQRVELGSGYVLDFHLNDAFARYSYTLARGGQRLIVWDNAPHHPDLASFPHHYDREDDTVTPSPLTGDPEQDME